MDGGENRITHRGSSCPELRWSPRRRPNRRRRTPQDLIVAEPFALLDRMAATIRANWVDQVVSIGLTFSILFPAGLVSPQALPSIFLPVVGPHQAGTPVKIDDPNPPAASAPVLAYDRLDRYTVLFGGTSGNTDLRETWTFEGGSWTDRTSADGPPAGNSGEGLSMTYDSADGYLLLSENSQTWSFQGGAWFNRSATAGPHLGIGGGMIAFDPLLNATVLFGENWSSSHPYTWLYQRGVWVNDTHGPQPDFSPSEGLLWDSTTRELVLVGCGSIFAFNISVWSRLPQNGSTCDTGGVNVVDDPEVSGLLAYGGSRGIDFGSGGPGVTWTFVNGSWIPKNLTPCPHVAGGVAGMAYDAGAREAVLFGGFGRWFSDQTWLFANGSWRNATALPAPPVGVNLQIVLGIVSGVALVAVLIGWLAVGRRGSTRGGGT